jgi:hypothetical protein
MQGCASAGRKKIARRLWTAHPWAFTMFLSMRMAGSSGDDTLGAKA